MARKSHAGTQRFWHYKYPPFHTVIRIHFISLLYHILFFLPSHFSSMEQMLMLTTFVLGAQRAGFIRWP